MDAKEFGQFIAAIRKENNMTQLELARKLDVTDKAVSRWERGLGFPDINTLEPLADALGISLVALMQLKRNAGNEPISTEKAEALLLDTIELSNEASDDWVEAPGLFAKITGGILLFLLAIAAILPISGFFMVGWNYNAASILTGLVAWGIPVWKMMISQKPRTAPAVVMSFCFALAAIGLQILNMANYIHIGDAGAVVDTIDAVVTGAGILSVSTILLNTVMVIVKRKTF